MKLCKDGRPQRDCCAGIDAVVRLNAQEEVTILKTATGNIEGTLTVPKMNKTIPVVLIISGSGPTDRNGNNESMQNNSLKLLAEGLKENGIASLRYDKRGVGQSEDAMGQKKICVLKIM